MYAYPCDCSNGENKEDTLRVKLFLKGYDFYKRSDSPYPKWAYAFVNRSFEFRVSLFDIYHE